MSPSKRLGTTEVRTGPAEPLDCEWNQLDHDYLNELIRDRSADDGEYMTACRLAADLWDGSQDEYHLAVLACDER